MPSTKFSFSMARRDFLTNLLGRAKPLLDRKAIKQFLFDCEKDIAWCLSGYPDGWGNNDDAEILQKIGKAAYELKAGLGQLHSSTKFALAARQLAEPDRGIDVETAKHYLSTLEVSLMRLVEHAEDLRCGSGTPMTQRVSEELATCFATNYVCSFSALPSLRHDGIYKQFIDSITEIDLPQAFQMRIGKRQMELANRRASVHLV